MEEEIITPEETFDYNKLRYILDNEGYIFHASFGGLILCDLGECTEYIGDIPEDYETLQEWHDKEIDKLNAWKIVDGNLVFDNVKYAELQLQYEKEESENSYTTKKYVNEKLKSTNSIYDDELSSNIEGSSLFLVENTKATEIVELLLKPNKAIKDSLKIKITTENMLNNKATSTAKNGLDFTVNEDKSITINGKATADTEIILNGSLTNTNILFFFKKGQNYKQCGLSKNVQINLYNYDGEDRTLISSKGNGTINLTSNTYITCATLSISSGSTFENITIYPMIRIGEYIEGEEYEYIQCEENEIINIDLGNYAFENNDTILIDRSQYVFTKKLGILYPSDDLYPSENLYPSDGDIETTGPINTQKSFKSKTLIQCDKDVSVTMKYFTDNYLNERFAAIKVEEEKIVAEVAKKLNENEFSTKLQVDYESVQIAWNKISEFIQFINAQLQIKDDNKNLLMALDKLGQHFYDESGNIIGDIGLIIDETSKSIAFSINGEDGSNRMVWGVNYNNTFIPVFYFEGHNTESGTEVGGLFYFEAPMLLQEHFMYLGQNEDGSYIHGLDNGERKIITFGNVDDVFLLDPYGNELLVFNSEYLKLYEQLEMGLNLYGDYSFDFKNNHIINTANVPTSEEVEAFSSTTGNYLYVGLRDGGGFTLWPSSSDARLKKDIKDSEVKALDIIKKIIHRQFKWKDTEKQVDIGYIAQELEEIDPNLIHKTKLQNEEGNEEYEYQINDLQVLSVCTKAIQEQQETIERQQKQIDMLMKLAGLNYEEEATEIKKHDVKEYGERHKINIKSDSKFKIKKGEKHGKD